MTDHTQRGDYLSGESDGQALSADERAKLDRVRNQLSSEALWDEPAPDGQFHLLAAAAAEAANIEAGSTEAGSTEAGNTEAQVLRPLEAVDAPPDRPRSVEAEVSAPISLDDRRRAPRAKWFGAGVLAAAAIAVIAAIGVSQLTSSDSGEDDLLEVAATHRLTATELDPDTIADLDVLPTAAGVQLELRLMGLDNAVGGDYYAAWLLPADAAGADTADPADTVDTEAIPLGSFHWRKGGVPIILWSGVDDPSYTRFIVTRQTQGDLGERSDQVVLTGEVPVLTAEG